MAIYKSLSTKYTNSDIEKLDKDGVCVCSFISFETIADHSISASVQLQPYEELAGIQIGTKGIVAYIEFTDEYKEKLNSMKLDGARFNVVTAERLD